MNARELHQYATAPVRVQLLGDLSFEGVFRTDILSDQALSVFIMNEKYRAGGVTLTIDEIVEIEPLTQFTFEKAS
jgi:hypothetical protein